MGYLIDILENKIQIVSSLVFAQFNVFNRAFREEKKIQTAVKSWQNRTPQNEINRLLDYAFSEFSVWAK
jgi:hypothetical protein